MNDLNVEIPWPHKRMYLVTKVIQNLGIKFLNFLIMAVKSLKPPLYTSFDVMRLVFIPFSISL